MLVIGLTGGIGCGKSSVAQLFAKLNVPIIDADIIARAVVQPSTHAYHLISAHFGPDILKTDATLDRQKLRTIIFQNSEQRLWLEHILHPLIVQEIRKQLGELDAPYCIVVIPLLIETGPYDFIDRILIIDAPEDKRRAWLKNRDMASEDEIDKIVQSQATQVERVVYADDIIHNAGDLNELELQVVKLDAGYKMG